MSEITGLCECGASVTREILEGGPFEDMLRRLPLVCDPCVERYEREDNERDQREKADREQARTAEWVKQSGIPAAHRRDLHQLDHPPATIAAAAEWALGGGGLLLYGRVGRGKTTIAGAAAWLRLQSGPVGWTSAPLIFARLSSKLGSDERDKALEALRGRHALVLDDVDKARPTQYGAEQIFVAVDQRIEHQAPLLVTSNLKLSEMAAYWPDPFGEAIASRLTGYCKAVHVEGADRRLKGAA